MFGVIAESSRPASAVRSTLSPHGFKAVSPTSLAVAAFGLCAVYNRCRSVSPLNRPFRHHLYPGYRFSGRYVLAGSSGGSRDSHWLDRMAGLASAGRLTTATDAGPH